MDSNELQKFIDQQNFETLGSNEMQIIISNAIEQSPLKNLNMQYVNEQGLHFVLVSFRDSKNNRCRGAFQIDLGSVAQSICDGLDEIQDQLIAIDQLNAIVKDQLYKSNNSFIISYCWGQDDKCSIEDWQYQFIRVKLSKDSCEKLRILIKDESFNVQQESDKTNFGTNAADMVARFNNMELHQEIGAIIETSSIEKALTSNMLQMDDAINFVRDNKHKNGKQHIKVVIPFNELGQFLTVNDWEVDYHNKDIKSQISEQKILDTENKKYILEQQIYNRVEKRLRMQDDIIEELFE